MSAFPDAAFERADESPDSAFYRAPRFVEHIDAAAVAAVTALYRETLAPGSDVLDLMTSHVSHLPADVAYGRVSGLGMNAAELDANPRLSARTLHDLNADPTLPYGDASFDAVLICVSVQYLTAPVAVLICVSVQYLTAPVAVFREIARILRPGGAVVVTFSNRCFPTKTVRVWSALDDAGHVALVGTYTREAGGFGEYEVTAHTPRRGDPLFGVVARRDA